MYMAEKNGSNGEWRGDRVGRCSTFLTSSFRESTRQKAERPRNYKGLWFFRYTNINVLNNQ